MTPILPASAAGTNRRTISIKTKVRVGQVAVVGGFLAGWQWLPEISGIGNHIRFLDRFFVSSPSLVAVRLWDSLTGQNHAVLIWHPLLESVGNALIGTAVAVVIGMAIGLAFASSRVLEGIFYPIAVTLNAVPRIAVIPVIILVAGSSGAADILTAVTVVVFLVLFNAFEAGRRLPPEVVANARILGESDLGIMLRVRLPYVLGWVFVSLPNAIAFGLIGTVTTELFTGSSGLGNLLMISMDNADATLTFVIVVVLAAVGVGLILGIGALQRLVLPWWTEGGAFR